jgi:hypothetical protein
LVAALVAAGATYYSDEFAVLDDHGQVHPYPKPLSLRSVAARYGERTPADQLGGAVGSTPARPTIIAVTRYVPGARWSPERRDSGAGALALLSNAIPARTRPEATMRAVGASAKGTTMFEGDRGDAAETAELLLNELRS